MSNSIATGGGGSANYLSEAEIMAWVEEQQDVQYGQLRGAMDYETTRGNMLQDLSELKNLAKAATKSLDDLPALQKALQSFQENYGAVSEFEGIAAEVGRLSGDVDATASKLEGYDAEFEEYQKAEPQYDADGNMISTTPPEEPGPLDKGKVDEWAEGVKELADNISHNQDLAMIRVGELRNTIDNIAKTGSQMLKGGNDAAAMIINNLA
jgi:hypothetical protein